MSNQNTTEFLLELNQVFEDKKWNTKENYEQVFNSLGSLGDYLSENKKDCDLIIELLKRFHWISLNDYYDKSRKLLINIIEDLPQRTFNIYTFPILKKRHQFNIKSGSFIMYLIKAILPSIPGAEKLSFEDISNYEQLEKVKFTKSDVLILVDDYIGSGETFSECIKEIRNVKEKALLNLFVFTLAIKKETLDKLQDEYKIYHHYNVLKGITDYNEKNDAENKKKIMRNIEQKLFLHINEFSLGYEESESLISLLRTPDNTFPIFWRTYKKRVKLIPPFSRYEKT